MKHSILLRKIQRECPLCGKIHELEERARNNIVVIKGEEVEYEETFCFCENGDGEEKEFTTGKMENRNLLNARNAYRRKHGLLTSDEIVKIREKYGLSQVDLAKLLGWGEITISRYESKAIQDEAYDNMLRIIMDNPLAVYEFFRKNCNAFTGEKRAAIKEKIMTNLDSYGREYLKRKALETDYVKYQNPSDANGNQLLNIDKLESVISYFASKISDLYKVKLMKMLWYADSFSYKMTGTAMTGLVYCHDNMGALPIGHYRIVGLENVNLREEEGYEYTKYRFLYNEKLDMSSLDANDICILDKVVEKFKDYSASDIVKYMHDEIAYKNTTDGQIIPFSLAKEIKEF